MLWKSADAYNFCQLPSHYNFISDNTQKCNWQSTHSCLLLPYCPFDQNFFGSGPKNCIFRNKTGTKLQLKKYIKQLQLAIHIKMHINNKNNQQQEPTYNIGMAWHGIAWHEMEWNGMVHHHQQTTFKKAFVSTTVNSKKKKQMYI